MNEQQSELRDLGWSIVELMGHRRLAGRVREECLFGTVFLRLEVPSPQDEETFVTQFYGGSSVYAITPTTEAIARAVSRASQPAPVQRWELPAAPATPERTDHDHDGDAAPWRDDEDEGNPDF